MFKAGDTCYFIESNIHVIEGVIRSCKEGMYIDLLLDAVPASLCRCEYTFYMIPLGKICS